MNFYDIGDMPRLTATFTNLAGANADPTAVVCYVRTPDKVIHNLTASKSGTGVYYYDFEITASGTHYYRFEGTGAVTAAAEDKFFVRASRIRT